MNMIIFITTICKFSINIEVHRPSLIRYGVFIFIFSSASYTYCLSGQHSASTHVMYIDLFVGSVKKPGVGVLLLNEITALLLRARLGEA